jgi:hypothetical protein
MTSYTVILTWKIHIVSQIGWKIHIVSQIALYFLSVENHCQRSAADWRRPLLSALFDLQTTQQVVLLHSMSEKMGSVDEPDLRQIPRDSIAGATVSDTSGEYSLDGSSNYHVIEYDIGDGMQGAEMLNKLDVTIEEGSPAAEAIRANAQVHVSTVAKAARAVHMNVVRKIVKRASGTAKSGFVRGKPPRVPVDLVDPAKASLVNSINQGAVLDTVFEGEERDFSASMKPVQPEHSEQGEDPSIEQTPENGYYQKEVVPGTVEASKKGESKVF